MTPATTQRPPAPSVNRFISGLVLVLLVCAGVMTSSDARAEDREKALKLFSQAKALHASGKTRDALGTLKRALKNFDNDGIRLTIVNRHLDLGEPEEAAAVLSQVADRKMRSMVKKMRRKIEDLLARPVTVKLSAEPTSTQVSIDSSEYQALPLTLDLPRGRHRFTFRAKGRTDKEIVKVLRGIKTVSVFASLAAPPGSWRVQLEPSGDLQDVRIVFNGKQVTVSAEERMKSLSLPRSHRPGRFKVQCLKGIDDFASMTIDIKTGRESIAICRFDEAPTEGIGTANIAVGSVMAALFAAGVGAGVGLFLSYDDDLAKYPPPRYQIDSSKPTLGGVSIGLGVVAGVLSGLFFAEVIDLGGDDGGE